MAMPRARKSLNTASLCTNSPRMVSGWCLDSSRAKWMASRTPKHMPKWAARMIFRARRGNVNEADSLCIAKLDGTMDEVFIFFVVYFKPLVCRTISSSKSM